MSAQLIYYVYLYLDDRGLPFYVGMGKGNRAFAKHHGNIVTPERDRIHFAERGLSRIGAWAIERKLIRMYGRRGIDRHGILENTLPGGPTSKPTGGFAGKKHTRERNEKLSAKTKGRKNPWAARKRPEHSAKMSGANNPSAKQICVFDSDNNLVFVSRGSFAKDCIENNIPYNIFQASHASGGKIIKENRHNKKYSKYFGWYAISSSIETTSVVP